MSFRDQEGLEGVALAAYDFPGDFQSDPPGHLGVNIILVPPQHNPSHAYDPSVVYSKNVPDLPS